MSVHCRPSTPANKHEDKTSSGSMLPWADTRPTAPDPASLLGWAPVLPRVSYLRTPPPYRRGSGATRGSRLRTLPHYRWGLQRRYVFHGSGSRLLIEMGYRAVTCFVAPDPAFLLKLAPELPLVSWLRTLLPHRGRLRCYHVSCGSLRVVGLRNKERQAHQSRWGLQDVRASDTIMTYKACRHAATVQHQPNWPLTGTATVERWPDRTVPCRWLHAMWQPDMMGCAPHRLGHHLPTSSH
jgi:hypothetical protein